MVDLAAGDQHARVAVDAAGGVAEVGVHSVVYGVHTTAAAVEVAAVDAVAVARRVVHLALGQRQAHAHRAVAHLDEGVLPHVAVGTAAEGGALDGAALDVHVCIVGIGQVGDVDIVVMAHAGHTAAAAIEESVVDAVGTDRAGSDVDGDRACARDGVVDLVVAGVTLQLAMLHVHVGHRVHKAVVQGEAVAPESDGVATADAGHLVADRG